jgi:hypothetical protein
MLKILLVYDDFQELTSVELMLKKTGFDVVGITSEFSLAEQLLSFNPQVVVAQGRTAKVSTANVGRRLRESVRWDGHSVLIFYPNAKPQPTELLKIRMDVGLEYPVEPTKLLQVLAQLGNLDANQLVDKLIKSMAQDTAAAGAGGPSSQAGQKSERESVYVSGGQVPTEQNRGIGGAAGHFAANEPGSMGVDSFQAKQNAESIDGVDPNQGQDPFGVSGGFDSLNEKTDVTGATQNGAASTKPTFPLDNRNENSNNVTGKSNGNADPSGITGTFGINPFSLENMTQDPLMQELENLLQKKPELTTAPPPIQDPARHKRHEQYMKTIPVQELASIKRRDAKLRLKDLIKDIDMTELGDQDVLRREYVKALYKKEG